MTASLATSMISTHYDALAVLFGRRRLIEPPLRPAACASSLVHLCAVPWAWAAFPPLLAISRFFSGLIDAKPRPYLCWMALLILLLSTALLSLLEYFDDIIDTIRHKYLSKYPLLSKNNSQLTQVQVNNKILSNF